MDYIKRKKTSIIRTDFSGKSTKFIEASPLVLVKIIDQDIYEGRVLLKNQTGNFVIYKIYSNSNIKYSIAPSVYYIPPEESLFVNIKAFEKNVSFRIIK
jgi:hypothetical protein